MALCDQRTHVLTHTLPWTPATAPSARLVPEPGQLAVLFGFVLISLVISLNYPLNHNFDEIGHLSVVRAQFEHPDLFADASRYLMLDPDRPAAWTSQANYINHPSLYYLLLAPIYAVTDALMVFRVVNIALVTAALGLIIATGSRWFSGAGARLLFAGIVISFPKTAIIAGQVNNDNLALLAAALVFAGLAGSRRSTLWLCLGLVLAGWTKLTALIALGGIAGLWQLWQIVQQRDTLFGQRTLLAAGAVLAGALPYLVTYARTGQLLYVNEAHFTIPPDQRVVLDHLSFIGRFASDFVQKWPSAEFSVPLWLSVILTATPLVLTALCLRRPAPFATMAGCTLTIMALMLVIQLCFGWSAYERLGDLTNAQTRYYNVFWPFLAFCATASLVAMQGRWRPAALAATLLLLLPTAYATLLLQMAGLHGAA